MGSRWACRDCVAPAKFSSIDRHVHRQKLAGAVAEQFRRVGAEAECLDVVRLVDDLNAVKRQLRAQGLKPQYMIVSEINRTADLYLKANWRELLELVWKKVQRSPDLMKFYEKEQRDRQRKTVNTLSQSVTTPATRSEIS